jgi:hypothetical protein
MKLLDQEAKVEEKMQKRAKNEENAQKPSYHDAKGLV